MKKFKLFLLFICLPLMLTAQLSTDEVSQIAIGIKKSAVERILQKNAIRRGVSFSLEDYRTTDFDHLDMPEEIILNEKNTDAYIIGYDHIVLVDGEVAILSLRFISDETQKLIDILQSKYGDQVKVESLSYWLTDKEFMVIGNHTNTLNVIRRDLFPMHYLDKIHNNVDVDDYEIQRQDVNGVENNTTYLSLEVANKLRMGMSVAELESILRSNYDTDLNINSYLSDLDSEEELALDFDQKVYTKYKYRNSSFIFFDGEYIGGKSKIALLVNKKLKRILNSLDQKYGKRYSFSTDGKMNAWFDNDLFITLENSENTTSINMVDKEYMSELALDFIKMNLKEAKLDYAFPDLFSLVIGAPKEDVVKALKTATSTPNFDLELNREDLKEVDLPEEIDKDITEAYSWNDLSFVLTDNKLALIYMDTHNATSSEYEKAMQFLTMKYGDHFTTEKKDEQKIWMTDTSLLILMYDGYEMGAALVDKRWVSQHEIEKLQEEMDKNN